MKKLLLSILLCLSAVAGVGAQGLAPEEQVVEQCLRVASEFIRNRSASLGMKRAPGKLSVGYVGRDEATAQTCYYVVNHNNGYVVVSADESSPIVLGYGDNAPIDVETAPAAMREWLDEYASQIVAARAAGTELSAPRMAARRTVIPPLVTSEWGQGSPFNQMCPAKSTTENYLTGCVATAMSQVMRVSPSRPVKGTGSKTYSATVGSGTQTLTANFGNTTYDWDNMPDVLDENSTSAQKTAVATLMYQCGVSMEMKYKTSESTSSSTKLPYALANYFGYGKSAVYYTMRDFYTEKQWLKMMIDELAAARPVIYHGTRSAGGHSFIVDGYDPTLGGDYFHLNWGWCGSSNGYFLLTNLAPKEDAYSSLQGAVFNMVADDGGEARYTVGIKGTVNANAGTFTKTSTSQKTFVTANSGQTSPMFHASTVSSFTAYLGYEIVNAETGASTFVQSGSQSMQLGYIYKLTGFATTPQKLTSGLANGTYNVYPAFRTSTSSSAQVYRCGVWSTAPQYFVMTISGTKVTFAEGLTPEEVDSLNEEPETERELCDGDVYDNQTDVYGVDIDYTRTFKYANVWNPLYLPFSLDYEEWADVADVAELSGVKTYDDGTSALVFISIKSGSTLPNMPYLIRPKEAGEMNLHFVNKDLKAAPEEGSNYLSWSTTRWVFNLYGNYHPITGEELNAMTDEYGGRPYVFGVKGDIGHCPATATLKAGRLYIIKSRNANGYWPAPVVRTDEDGMEIDDTIYLSVDGVLYRNDATGITPATSSARPTAVYDLQGRPVRSMGRGIFIKNGRKLINN